MKENSWLQDSTSGISASIYCMKFMFSIKMQKMKIGFILNVARDCSTWLVLIIRLEIDYYFEIVADAELLLLRTLVKVTTSCQLHKWWCINLTLYENELFVHEIDKKNTKFYQNLIRHSKVIKRCAY